MFNVISCDGKGGSRGFEASAYQYEAGSPLIKFWLSKGLEITDCEGIISIYSAGQIVMTVNLNEIRDKAT